MLQEGKSLKSLRVRGIMKMGIISICWRPKLLLTVGVLPFISKKCMSEKAILSSLPPHFYIESSPLKSGKLDNHFLLLLLKLSNLLFTEDSLNIKLHIFFKKPPKQTRKKPKPPTKEKNPQSILKQYLKINISRRGGSSSIAKLPYMQQAEGS